MKAARVVSMLVVLGLMACDPLGAPYKDAAGVELTSGGDIIGHVALCAGEKVTAITLQPGEWAKTPGASPPASMMWGVASSTGGSIESFPIGSAPDGFRTFKPLAEPLDPHASYYLVITTDLPGATTPAQVYFFPDDLHVDRVMSSNGNYVTSDAFHGSTPRKCSA